MNVVGITQSCVFPPGEEAVVGPAPHNIRSSKDVPVEMSVSTQRFRPGSGLLSVKVVTDGPTRVLQITDIKYQVLYRDIAESIPHILDSRILNHPIIKTTYWMIRVIHSSVNSFKIKSPSVLRPFWSQPWVILIFSFHCMYTLFAIFKFEPPPPSSTPSPIQPYQNNPDKEYCKLEMHLQR